MALALFRRLAQLGRFEPARSVLPSLLGSGGPFGSLRSIDQQQIGGLLTQLAIVLPDETSSHLAVMIERASAEDLASLANSRRDLVWTLEKLVWHSRTFDQAADSLLKLALAEIENYANNATGTWVSLFGAMLPGTAASAAARSTYLSRVAVSDSAEVRALVIKAAAQGLTRNEHIGVSGEIQGGVLVEPRGTPPTWVEVGNYRRALLGILNDLRNDSVSEIAESSTDAILHAMHPLIDDPLVGEDLARILETFSGDALNQTALGS